MASLDEAITAQVAVGCDEHEPGGADVQHLDTAVGEQREQLHDVEVGDEGVSQLDERPGEHRFSRHRSILHSYRTPLGLGVLLAAPDRRSAAAGPRHPGHLAEGTLVAERVAPATG